MRNTDQSTLVPHRRRTAVSRGVAVSAAVLLALGAAACGDDGEVDAVADGGAEEAEGLPGLDANGMLGLEVTAVGEVTEVLENNAFRMDKDGLDPASAEGADPGTDGGDLDPYDTEAFTEGDEAFRYGTEQEDVLVLVPGADLDLRAGDPVRVSGTIRSLDAESIEEVYDVAIDEDVYAPYEDQLLIVAETVQLP